MSDYFQQNQNTMYYSSFEPISTFDNSYIYDPMTYNAVPNFQHHPTYATHNSNLYSCPSYSYSYNKSLLNFQVNNDTLSCTSSIQTPEIEQHSFPSQLYSYSFDTILSLSPPGQIKGLYEEEEEPNCFYSLHSQKPKTFIKPSNLLEDQEKPLKTDAKARSTQLVETKSIPSKKKPSGKHFSTFPTASQKDKKQPDPDLMLPFIAHKSNKGNVDSLETFPCTFHGCRKVFTRPYNLKSHMKTHSPERPHACVYAPCDWKFVRLHDLKRHELQHTNVKPYLCTYCQRRFARSDALRRHLKVDISCSLELQRDPSSFELPRRGRRKGTATKKN
ncbi:hypothetical protein BY458DRAFT_501384 [Sporodiniella umbellata]|nr:hypothetical protein BY458DRAFT_501384 [Sporodiniella umbellata]